MEDKYKFIIIIGITIFIFVIATIFYWAFQKDKEINLAQEEIKKQCDVFWTLSSGYNTDCYEGRFYNRMLERNTNETYCFTDTLNRVYLICKWQGGKLI